LLRTHLPLLSLAWSHYTWQSKRCPGEQGGTIIDYVASPHLYLDLCLACWILVLYVGITSIMLQLLASVIGPPMDEGRWD
jgi:hypothetical protein